MTLFTNFQKHVYRAINEIFESISKSYVGDVSYFRVLGSFSTVSNFILKCVSGNFFKKKGIPHDIPYEIPLDIQIYCKAQYREIVNEFLDTMLRNEMLKKNLTEQPPENNENYNSIN
jgi:hypothetical protein